MKLPSKDEIRRIRLQHNLTQQAAAEMIRSPSYRTWQAYELGQNRIPEARWELFLLKISQLNLKKTNKTGE